MKMIYKALLSIIVLAWFSSNCFSQATLSIGSVSGTPGNSIPNEISFVYSNEVISISAASPSPLGPVANLLTNKSSTPIFLI